MPERPDTRAVTGRNSAITAGFCMKPDIRPAIADVSRISRSSMPFARRSSHTARRLSAPVRSRPAPRIIVAITAITALPEKPSNSCAAGTSPVSPSTTSTTSAVASARMRSIMNIAMVKPTSPSTIIMSRVRVRPVSMGAGLLRRPFVQQVPDAVAELQAATLEVRLPPPSRARHRAARAGAVAQPRRGVEHVEHVLLVVLPVGRQVQQPAGLQALAKQRGELRLHEPALVVALLVPRVREVDAH